MACRFESGLRHQRKIRLPTISSEAFFSKSAVNWLLFDYFHFFAIFLFSSFSFFLHTVIENKSVTFLVFRADFWVLSFLLNKQNWENMPAQFCFYTLLKVWPLSSEGWFFYRQDILVCCDWLARRWVLWSMFCLFKGEVIVFRCGKKRGRILQIKPEVKSQEYYLTLDGWT